ncbi:MAG: VanZ family protein [Clostridia bacterium]|nr:VanZ family protein [Clostridia bacterium]
MKKKTVTALCWLAVAVCMGVIFYFSAQPAEVSQSVSDDFAFAFNLPFGSFIIRKAAHFLEFAGLSVLIFNALHSTCGKFRPFTSFIITAAYALTDEIHQIFVDGRACRFFDWTVDCSGAAAALIFVSLIIYISGKNKRRCSDDR